MEVFQPRAGSSGNIDFRVVGDRQRSTLGSFLRSIGKLRRPEVVSRTGKFDYLRPHPFSSFLAVPEATFSIAKRHISVQSGFGEQFEQVRNKRHIAPETDILCKRTTFDEICNVCGCERRLAFQSSFEQRCVKRQHGAAI